MIVSGARDFATGHAERADRVIDCVSYEWRFTRFYTQQEKRTSHKRFIIDCRLTSETFFVTLSSILSRDLAPFLPLFNIPYERVLHKARCRFGSFVRLKAFAAQSHSRHRTGAKVVEFSHRPRRPRDCADRRVDVVARCDKRHISFRRIDPRKYHPLIIPVSGCY